MRMDTNAADRARPWPVRPAATWPRQSFSVTTMPCFIFVEPSNDGWIVRGDFRDSPRTFPNGARAERAAREIAQRLADAGEPVILDIRLRDGARAGRFLFPPRVAETEAALALRA